MEGLVIDASEHAGRIPQRPSGVTPNAQLQGMTRATSIAVALLPSAGTATLPSP